MNRTESGIYSTEWEPAQTPKLKGDKFKVVIVGAGMYSLSAAPLRSCADRGLRPRGVFAT